MIEATLTRLLSLACPRTYPVVAPQTAKTPFIVYTRVSTPRLRDFDGSTGMAMPTFRVDAYADDFDTARALANSIRVKVDGYRDKEVQEIALVGEQDMSDLVTTQGRTRIMMEFKIAHSE
ncbi:DUF3168 domain-containing protein [Sphingomonas sp. 22R3R2A-7]|uniref:DUF3168 domain-containing protein n=1 Tax=Sphingomonas sp. 22R3R2A-7 TaxID=3050230 RepID=UPI002FE1C341